jgi:hypothetical protein
LEESIIQERDQGILNHTICIYYINSIHQQQQKGIRHIEASVVQVNEIFADLASLVEDQGHMIGTNPTRVYFCSIVY